MSKPIFILGCQRSGTTWLSNILCRNSEIAGIQDNEKGIIESCFFSYVRNRFEDLEQDENFIEFVEAYSSSDYFKLSGLDKEIFYQERPSSYPEFFKLLMEQYASSKNSSYWLEKTPFHALYLEEIRKYFPKAKFIAIRRNIIEVIRSLVRKRFYDEDMKRKLGLPKILLIMFGVYHEIEINKFIDHFDCQSDSFMKIRFEDLKKSKKETISYICQFLGIDFKPTMLKNEFKPNTSFQSKKERKESLSTGEEKFISGLARFLEMLPYFVFRLLRPVKMRMMKAYLGYGLPDWFYSIQKSKIKKS